VSDDGGKAPSPLRCDAIAVIEADAANGRAFSIVRRAE
jgi:hypothetical protein